MQYEVQITWLDNSGNAACIGNDEVVTVDAANEREACEEALDGAMYAHDDDWNSGLYSIAAECSETYRSVDFVPLSDD